MANEKKNQTSTGKKKMIETKTKNVKRETQENKEVKVTNEKKKKTNQLEGKNVNQKNSSKKNQSSKINETTNSKKLDSKKENNTKKVEKKEESTSKVKNRNEKVASSTIVSSDEMGKLVKIILVLIIIVVAFYGLTVIITKFQKTSIPERNQNTVPAVIQYDEILIGTILNQARDEYYVLIQKDDDQYQTLTSYYLQKYSSDSKSLKVYKSNMNSIYNEFYISETSNVRTNNVGEFRVSTITLVKIKNHEIVEAYEGLEEVESAFKKLTDKK